MGEIALHEHRFDQAIELAMQGQVRLKILNKKKNKRLFCFFSKFQLMNMIGIDLLLLLSNHYDKIQIKIHINEKKFKLIDFILKNIFLLIKYRFDLYLIHQLNDLNQLLNYILIK